MVFAFVSIVFLVLIVINTIVLFLNNNMTSLLAFG